MSDPRKVFSRNWLLSALRTMPVEELKSLMVAAKLTYIERQILKMRYGLDGDRFVYTLEETGRVFKATRERIRSIESKAIAKLSTSGRLWPGL